MVKHGHKKEKNGISYLLYDIKTSEDKTERNLNEGKFGWKPSFKKEKKRENKGASHQTLQNIRGADWETHFRYMITQT